MKTLSGLEWFGQHYGENSFFFKADADIFIDIFRIIRFINNYEFNWSESDFIFGKINRKGEVFRPKEKDSESYDYYNPWDSDHWRVSFEEYPNDTFPPYPGGKNMM